MQALSYETFIRGAFGLKAGKIIGRWEDPAQMANTDAFMDSNLSSVKCAVGYAMEIFNTEIFNNRQGLQEVEHNRIDVFHDRIIAANDLNEVSKLIDEYKETVQDRYYNVDDGVISLK
jgi:hypothetical protein